jgi:FkbH-like protein
LIVTFWEYDLAMNDLFILGSSYLIPNNKEWSSNLEPYKLRFAEYGDWNALLNQGSASQDRLLIYFLDDLLPYKSYSPEILEEILRPLIMLLEKSLQTNRTPIIACISEGQNFDVIRYSKGGHYLQKAFRWLLDEFETLAGIYEHFYILDLKHAFGEIGFSRAFDNRNWCFAHCRLSTLGIRVIAKNTRKILERHYSAAAKVLVLDCDNTIWGGVIGEDKLDGIVLGQDGLGQAFVDFQKEVKALIKQGVIVVLSSKNNENEVWEVFEEHKAMVINKNDVVAWRINWNEKSISVKELAGEIDLGIESFVFWDDNPVERDKMKLMAPEVVTVEVPAEVYEWPYLLRNLFEFAKFNTTEDDADKTELYHKRRKFVRDSTDSDDELSYLKSINLSPKAHELDRSNIQRASQLCIKTNQFNLRSARHSAEDLVAMSGINGDLCFLISLEDIYGSHGIVGLICMEKLNESTAFLDTFLMSCRVLGRHLDSWMLREALSRCKAKGIDYLIGGFIPTERNIVASTFFLDQGFSHLSQASIGDELMAYVPHEKELLYRISTAIEKLPFEDIYV